MNAVRAMWTLHVLLCGPTSSSLRLSVQQTRPLKRTLRVDRMSTSCASSIINALPSILSLSSPGVRRRLLHVALLELLKGRLERLQEAGGHRGGEVDARGDGAGGVKRRDE